MNERLKELMDKNGVNQVKLSEIAGVSQAFVCNMLKGYKTPSVSVLKRIADYFGVPMDFFVK